MADTATPLSTRDAIMRLIAEALGRGEPIPSVRSMVATLRLSGPNAVQYHLKALEKAGMIPRPVGPRGERRSDRMEKQPLPLWVPHYGDVPCGPPVQLDDQPPCEMVNLAENLGDDNFALTARGRSMEKAGIMDGDRLIFRPLNGKLTDGKAVVAIVNGEVTCKILKRRGEEWWLLPRGNVCKPIRLDPDNDKVYILGLLVALFPNADQ